MSIDIMHPDIQEQMKKQSVNIEGYIERLPLMERSCLSLKVEGHFSIEEIAEIISIDFEEAKELVQQASLHAVQMMHRKNVVVIEQPSPLSGMLAFDQQKLATAYKQIASGQEDFRVAIGDFMDEFFLYCTNEDERQELLNQPIELPMNPTQEQRGWAAFCAGAAEYLAEHYGLQCPAWALDTAYQMPEPWYINSDATPAMRTNFQETAPQAFRRRNVFCSHRVFSNPHPSSREPGDFQDLQRKRIEMLNTMSREERDAYIASHNSYMPKPLHISL